MKGNQWQNRARAIPFWEEQLTEDLLQYIWQFQYFNNTGLVTTAGEKLMIIHPGTKNQNQGPDFLAARLTINGVLLSGAVEIHVRSRLWRNHGHDHDENYKSVILHVVFEDDAQDARMPVLELRSRISKLMLERYRTLTESRNFIPCQDSIGSVAPLILNSWLERLILEKLAVKSEKINSDLDLHNQHWEKVFWWHLAGGFGLRVNQESFYVVAQSLPLRVLAAHRQQIQQVEALLLGQCGLLAKEYIEHYPRLLKKEYAFLQRKYGLRPVHMPVYFHRMRPANFPTLRLAQLAMLIFQQKHFFATVLETKTVWDMRAHLLVTANDYWHYHYRLDQPTSYSPKSLGSSTIDTIISNIIIPFLFCYGNRNKSSLYIDRAVEWLQQLPPENNAIIEGFSKLGVEAKDAFNSQSLLYLKTRYCDAKLCLQCSVGNQLLKAPG